MNEKFVTTVLQMAVLAALLASCAAQSPQMDRSFGAAVERAQALQTIDPNAGRAAKAAGVDGIAAAAAMERYRASYKNPPEPVNVFNIGVGASAGGQ